MKVIDPGHVYELADLDEVPGTRVKNVLTFVKRVGPKYPGNEGPSHPGTTTQEVLRALIDRMEYVDQQQSHPRNVMVIYHLRQAIWELEIRAACERGDNWPLESHYEPPEIERMETCSICGHVRCEHICPKYTL